MKIRLLILVLIGLGLGAVFLWRAHNKQQTGNSVAITGPWPSKVLDLTKWKLTLPVGTEKKANHPLEIWQPQLAKYKLDPWFNLNAQEDGVVFRAPVNAPTTGGTKYARSELREMKDGGKNSASWSSEEGVHSMFLDEAITAIPTAKQHVVAGQIHGSDDDIIVVRLEFPNLYVNVDGENVFTLNSNYKLGERFTVKFVVENGQTKIYYNGSNDPVYTLNLDYTDAYFKAGAYTQSNCNREEATELCKNDNYGEVVIYKAEVKHK